MSLLDRSRYGASVLAFLLFVPWSGHAAMPDTLSARLEIRWSTPITTEMTPEDTFGRSEGLVLSEGAVSPDGAIVFLGSRLGGQRPAACCS
jgi:hypothetical protein